MNIESLKFTKEHEWVSVENNIATIGITDHAQSELGDIIFVDLPETESNVKYMESFGTIEAVKAVSELYSPVTGKVIQVNSQLESAPENINSNPYSDGWIIKVEIANESELNSLLSYKEYQEFIGK